MSTFTTNTAESAKSDWFTEPVQVIGVDLASDNARAIQRKGEELLQDRDMARAFAKAIGLFVKDEI